MSLSQVQISAQRAAALPARLVLPAFAVTIFASALLLFALEPMFTKMALPALGGSPSVWSVAMVFFQTLMFAGYCYAYAIVRWLPPRTGGLVHALVLAIAMLSLPIALRAEGAPPSGGDPTWWLISVFAASIGLPFFALSAQGPLLQAWFSRSGHRQAEDPYFLYGASNIGSFAALVAYPLLIEPLSGLAAQSGAWTIGFALLALLMTICGVATFNRPLPDAGAAVTRHASTADRDTTSPRLAAGLAWVALAFVPSALLVSVTAHISTSVAAAPLLWVAPLGLYLLTFVLVFRQPSLVPERALSMAQPWAAAIIIMAAGVGALPTGVGLIAHLVLFTVNALVCHGALYRLRPDARYLTLFYAAMSLGGALGGLFAGLAAPQLFTSVLEYPLLIAAALFCAPGALQRLNDLQGKALARLVLGPAVILVAAWALSRHVDADIGRKLLAAGAGLMILLNWRNAGRVALLGLLTTLSMLALERLTSERETFRSFFGVHLVEETQDGTFRTLAHGVTLHGAIRIRNEDGAPVAGRPVPTTYYAPDGPLGDAIAAARSRQGGLRNVSFIGLGAGALACHVQQDEALTYYEIDPMVVRLARDATRFRYLSDCAPQTRFVIGDARLTLDQQSFSSDIIVVDAFSSDAIPVHLLTREAFELYLRKLSPHGLIAVHISNNAMEFSGIVARIAAELGLVAYVRSDLVIDTEDRGFRKGSVAAVVARDPADLGSLLREGSPWRRIEPDMKSWLWTDDYSTILSAIAAKFIR